MSGTPSSSKKRRPFDENAVSTPAHSFQFLDGLGPDPSVKKRRRTQKLTDIVVQEVKEEYARKEKEAAAEREASKKAAAAEAQRTKQTALNARVDKTLRSVKEDGYDGISGLLDDILHTTDQHRSSQVTQMLMRNGAQLLDAIRARAPDMFDDYVADYDSLRISAECAKLASKLRPEPGTPVASILDRFSLAGIVHQAEESAPTLCQVLRDAMSRGEGMASGRQDTETILATTISLLVKARNEQASEFQTSVAMYLLACGASRSQFEVLNHAGLTLSYSAALSKLKQLSRDRMEEMIDIAHRRAFMIIWDNLNIAFRIAEQRQGSKNHFDNGTTATLIPLWNVAYGELPPSLKPPRTSRLPLLDFGPADLLPNTQQICQIEAAFVWLIEDILYNAYPALREQLGEAIPPPPIVQAIPLHKTEQYPLPAMKIDESSLEGTLDVLDTIICKNLQLDAQDIEKHGIILCAGDQLSVSLLDKVSACRRDDTDLVDNVGQYTEPQLGLFHFRMAAARAVANQFWGKANDNRVPWSLYRVNDLLGRKKIPAGWKAKSLPPFRPVSELILMLLLPAHILDAFRIQCGMDSLSHWVTNVKSRDDVTAVARTILAEHCSPRRVERLRRRPLHDRDLPRENIILFNFSALLLLLLRSAVRRGDVGTILNVLTYWMVMFRGTGKMPKYADAIFQTLMRLKAMDPKLRDAYLMNWLANTTGLRDRFKEMDLLQEHQNFWAKIMYNASGSNRNWDWLRMISVCIFILRDVMQNMQREFKTPHNGKSHTSPSTDLDIEILLNYLKAQKLQSHFPARENNHLAEEVPDMMATGTAYANTAGAFKNFRRPLFKARNDGVSESAPAASASDPAGIPMATDGDVDEDADTDTDRDADMDKTSGLDGPFDIGLDDLTVDDEEFPSSMDTDEYVQNMRAIIEVLVQSES